MLDIQQEDDLEPMTMHEVSNAWTLVFDAYKKDSATNATALSDATYALVDKILNEYDTDPYIEIADIRNDLVAIALKEAAKQGEYVHNTVTRCRQSAKRYLNNLRMPIEQSNQEHILSNLKEEKEHFEIRA